MKHSGPWREPSEESAELYPNLVVHDGRVTGSITIGKSRLPVWAIIHSAIAGDWDEVEAGWSPEENYGFTEKDLKGFLYNLLEMRGEFGRLLLMLANAERLENEQRDKQTMNAIAAQHPGVLHADEDGSILNITPGDPDALELSAPWWVQPEIIAPLREQLQRCLDALDEGVENWKKEMEDVDEKVEKEDEE